jgi:serine/threonine protein kinase
MDLFDFMSKNKKKFCEAEAKLIWIDLLTGIKSLHEMSIYHRDLKLQNILYFSTENKAKIIDFGMATCFSNPEGNIGSPLFMSPQVLKN